MFNLVLGYLVFGVFLFFLVKLISYNQDKESITKKIVEKIEKYFPSLFFGLGFLLLFIYVFISLQLVRENEKKYLEFKKDFYAKNASILKPSNFDEIQQLQNTICASTKLHNNSDFDKKIKRELHKNLYEYFGTGNGVCAAKTVISNIEKNVSPLQIRDDILYRQYKLDYYSSNIEIGLECAHYNSWGYDRLVIGFRDHSFDSGFYLSPELKERSNLQRRKESEYFYNLYKVEYNSLKNFLLEKIKNTELINNTPLLEKKILGEIVSKNEELNYVNKLNKRFRSQECNFIRDKNREIDLIKKQKDDPIAKKLGRAAKSARDGAQDVIDPLKNKADKLFDQFKDGFND